MTDARKHAHLTRPVRPVIPVPVTEDVDADPLTEAEIAALSANDGTYVSWDDLKAELKL